MAPSTRNLTIERKPCCLMGFSYTRHIFHSTCFTPHGVGAIGCAYEMWWFVPN